MCTLFSKIKLLDFDEEPFTKREAWHWLVMNSTNGKVSCSLRNLANIWKWHRSKVERFLRRVKSESLIETEIKSGKLIINICNPEYLGMPAQTNETLRESNQESISSQYQGSRTDESQFRVNSEGSQTQSVQQLSSNCETISNQNQVSYPGQEEEKKKRSKKRKEEELLKEKNIPYGDTKKEKLIPFQFVQESDVEAWVEEELRTPIDLSWELGKFKDHWLSTRNKPPKDGIAAFRNWIRKSLEINRKYGGKIERFNKKPGESGSEQATGFERFLAGGARALAKLAEH